LAVKKRILRLWQEFSSKAYFDQITEADCQGFIRFLRKRYDSEKGVRTVCNVFQGWNTFLRAYKIFIAGSLLGKLDYAEKILDAYTKDELRLSRKPVPTTNVCVGILLVVGCRDGEVGHAEWCDLDFKKNVLHVQPNRIVVGPNCIF
jgi:hypothetical protein